LYDLATDPGERDNVISSHPEVGRMLEAEYDKWWEEVQPLLVNEKATPPAVNPYHTEYWQQFRGPGPNNIPPGSSKARP
jgi:arylsulfatase